MQVLFRRGTYPLPAQPRLPHLLRAHGKHRTTQRKNIEVDMLHVSSSPSTVYYGNIYESLAPSDI